MAPSATFAAGERIFLPGASGEPTALAASVLGARGVEVTTSFVPGVNRLDTAMIGDGSRVTGLFMQPGLAEAQRNGSFRHLPLSYGGMVKFLRESRPFDTCVIQVSPPDAAGLCSLGVAAEFTPDIMRAAGRVIAIVNPNMPRLVHAPTIALAACSLVIEADTPLVTYAVGDPDAAAQRIAQTVAEFIEDGAALQVGLGKLPHALLQALCARRRLRLHSGMIPDGVMDLAAAGALDPDWEHAATVVLGSATLYDWMRGRSDIHVRPAAFTHDPARLARLDRLVAVNSALEVDLFGQCNLELASGRAVSGAGGAPDFARGARLSAGGISIIALPSTFGGGNGSRILPRIDHDGVVSLPRTEVDVVVTEHGAADLRGRSVHERAEALMAIAAPSAHAMLQQAWRAIAARL